MLKKHVPLGILVGWIPPCSGPRPSRNTQPGKVACRAAALCAAAIGGFLPARTAGVRCRKLASPNLLSCGHFWSTRMASRIRINPQVGGPVFARRAQLGLALAAVLLASPATAASRLMPPLPPDFQPVKPNWQQLPCPRRFCSRPPKPTPAVSGRDCHASSRPPWLRTDRNAGCSCSGGHAGLLFPIRGYAGWYCQPFFGAAERTSAAAQPGRAGTLAAGHVYHDPRPSFQQSRPTPRPPCQMLISCFRPDTAAWT